MSLDSDSNTTGLIKYIKSSRQITIALQVNLFHLILLLLVFKSLSVNIPLLITHIYCWIEFIIEFLLFLRLFHIHILTYLILWVVRISLIIFITAISIVESFHHSNIQLDIAAILFLGCLSYLIYDIFIHFVQIITSKDSIIHSDTLNSHTAHISYSRSNI